MQMVTRAYQSKDIAEFMTRGCVFFAFQSKCEVSFAPVFEGRLGFLQNPPEPRSRSIIPHLRNSAYAHDLRASLVISDDPILPYGSLDPKQLQRWFKIGELTQSAARLDLELADWPSFERLDQRMRARILAEPIMRLAQRQRIPEHQLLGYTRYTWEHAYQTFVLIHDQPNNQVLLFPKAPVLGYQVYQGNLQESNTQTHSTLASLVFEDERIWAYAGTSTHLFSYLTKTHEPTWYTTPSEVEQFIDQLADVQRFGTFWLLPGLPQLRMHAVPKPTQQIQYQYYLPEKTFTNEHLLALARELNIKGFSSKTKAELSILIAEAIAKLPTDQQAPALLFTSQGTGRPEDLDLDYTSPFFRQAREQPAEAYFKFASRCVGGSAYAPKLPPLPAGRIPTDGAFPSYYGLAPLDLFA